MLDGFHHVTAISASPQATFDFYSSFLGLRLVKRTVNFDDPGTYHLYFGGAAGALLTFFPWRVARRSSPARGQAVSIALRGGGLKTWEARARAAKVDCSMEPDAFGRQALALRDPCGLNIKLVADLAIPPGGLGPLQAVTIWESDPAPLAGFLTGVLGFALVQEHAGVQRFQLGDAFVDLVQNDARGGRTSPGSIHHIAFRLAEGGGLEDWRKRLTGAGVRVTIPMDRRYFHSIYFRPFGHVLFEIATSSPGFTVDEDPAALGQSLCLPPWLESQRPQIESRLPLLMIPAVEERTND